MSYQVFQNLFENKKNERLFTGCIIGTDRKNGSNIRWNRTQSIGNQSLALETLSWPEMVSHNRNCVFINDDNKSNNDNNNDNDNENIHIGESSYHGSAQKLAML